MTTNRNLVAARAALGRGNPARALEHINDSKAFDQAETWQLQTQAYLALNRIDEARQSVSQGLRLEPQNSQLEILYSRVLSRANQYQEAEASLLRVLGREPQNVDALFYYGWLLAEAGDSDGARNVIDALPDWARASDPNTMALQAYVAIIDGKKAESARYLQTGLEIDPENTHLRQLAGIRESMDHRMGAAADHLIGAAMADPSRAGDLGREGRYLNHPLMAPTRLITRIGPGRLWIAWIMLLFIGRRVLPTAVLVPLVVIYLTGAIYSWVAPPLLRAWLKRKGEL